MPKKKNMTNHTVRWVLLLVLCLITFSLGLIRSNYVLNFTDYSLPFLLPRNTAEQLAYPLHLSHLLNSLLHDPRWLSALFYLIYPAVGTCLAVHLIFHKKNYVQLTLLFYSTGLVLLVGLVFYSVLLQEYNRGYAIAQYFKKIYQEPYASLLLVGSFYWDTKKRAESGERRAEEEGE